MKAKVFAILLFFTLITGACAKHPGFQAMNLPAEQAKLQDLSGGEGEEPDNSDEGDLPEISTDHFPTSAPEKSWRNLGSIAQWVVQNESKKIGPVCNRFIQRVLQLMGFGRGSWLANDFDRYVDEKFSSYDKETFGRDDNTRLKSYFTELPNKAAVILQWKRAGAHGHVAIVQKLDEDYVIYHASLNRFRPKAQRLRLSVLLASSKSMGAGELNIFSNFKK